MMKARSASGPPPPTGSGRPTMAAERRWRAEELEPSESDPDRDPAPAPTGGCCAPPEGRLPQPRAPPGLRMHGAAAAVVGLHGWL
jgi:hypothetical protein